MNVAFLLNMALMAVVLLFSVIVHEVAHGYVAWLNGDPTARMAGRITLNPIPHIDPIYTILVPVLLIVTGSPFIIGAARPVPVNPTYFRNYRLGELTTSLAGCASNLALAAIFSLLANSGLGGLGLLKMAAIGAHINIILAIFNLIPIPPLDGSHVVALILPPHLLQYYRYLEPLGLPIVILLLISGLLWRIILPFYFLIVKLLHVPLIF
jgi:Zn-dependent protease